MASSVHMASGEVNPIAPAASSVVSMGMGRRLILRIGGVSGVVGALLAGVANAMHPSEFRLEAHLQQIAQSTTWGGVHLTLLFGLALILVTLLALTLTTEREPGPAVAHLAWLAALLGGTLMFVSTAIDGFAMNQLARSWSEAAPAEKATALHIAAAVNSAQYAIFSLSVAIFLGIGICLYGLTTTLSRAYPRSIGWLAIVSGAGTFVVGVAQTLGGPSFRATEPMFLLFSILSTVWVFVMGVLMWRKSRGRHAQASRA